MRDLLEAARGVKARGQLVSERLVVDKAVCLCRTDGLFVKVHGIERAAINPGNLRANQGSAILEVFRTVLRPRFELFVVGHKSLKMLLPLLGRCTMARRRMSKRIIEAKLDYFEHLLRCSQQALLFR